MSERYEAIKKIIDDKVARGANNLSTDDILNLTIASRLNGLSDNGFVEAMKGLNRERRS